MYVCLSVSMSIFEGIEFIMAGYVGYTRFSSLLKQVHATAGVCMSGYFKLYYHCSQSFMCVSTPQNY